GLRRGAVGGFAMKDRSPAGCRARDVEVPAVGRDRRLEPVPRRPMADRAPGAGRGLLDDTARGAGLLRELARGGVPVEDADEVGAPEVGAHAVRAEGGARELPERARVTARGRAEALRLEQRAGRRVAVEDDERAVAGQVEIPAV